LALRAFARERPDSPSGGTLAGGLASALLFSAFLLVPALGPSFGFLFLLTMLAPFPLILVRLRHGLLSGLLSALMAASLVGGFFAGWAGLMFFTMFAVPGLLIGDGLARGRGLLRGCGWAFAALAVQIAALLLASGAEIAQALTPLAEFRSARVAELKAQGAPSEVVEDFDEQAERVYDVMKVVYPGALFIVGALLVLANAVQLRAYLVRRDPGWLDGGEFEGIRWPLGFSLVFVLGGAAVALPASRSFGYNVVLVVLFFYLLQGLAVVTYYARRLAGPPLLRLGLTFLVLLNPWAPQILALVGLFDTWADFRKYAKPPESGSGQN